MVIVGKGNDCEVEDGIIQKLCQIYIYFGSCVSSKKGHHRMHLKASLYGLFYLSSSDLSLFRHLFYKSLILHPFYMLTPLCWFSCILPLTDYTSRSALKI